MHSVDACLVLGHNMHACFFALGLLSSRAADGGGGGLGLFERKRSRGVLFDELLFLLGGATDDLSPGGSIPWDMALTCAPAPLSPLSFLFDFLSCFMK